MSVTFRVNDIYATIQGEGKMVGTPMILLRLHGCSVGCTFCDTKETWAMGDAALPWRRATLEEARGSNELWAELDEDSLVRAVREECDGNAPGVEWVLLTGGEPAEQPIRPLVRALLDFPVHLRQGDDRDVQLAGEELQAPTDDADLLRPVLFARSLHELEVVDDHQA